MAFIGRLGEQSYKVEIEETGKSVYRVSVDGNEFIVDGKKTGRTKTFYAREAILQHLEDLEDVYLATQRLRRPTANKPGGGPK